MKILLTTFTLLIICSLFFPNNRVIAQVANYVFTETTGAYQAINSSSPATWSGTSTGGANATKVSFDLPFSFCMGGATYPSGTTINMHQNGWIVFGSVSPTSTTRHQPLTNFNNTISAFGTDLETTGTSSMGAVVTGTSPWRVITFQWGQRYFGDSGQTPFLTTNYWRRVTSGHSNDRLHFQIKLYETSGVIEFHYLISNPRTTSSGSVTNTVQVGLRGASASDFNVRTKSSTNSIWNGNHSAGSALPSGTSNTMTFNNVRNDVNNKPDFIIPSSPGNGTTTASAGTGTIFRWTPPVSGTWDNPASWVNCYNPLAVTLDKLTGLAEQRSNKVEWETASEINNDYFIVETSANGIDWNELDRVNGMGTITKRNSYELYHQNPEDIQYYRLKQVDFDGTKTDYGPVVIQRKALPVTLVRKTNLLGQDVDENYTGVILFHYSDGTTVKIYR